MPTSPTARLQTTDDRGAVVVLVAVAMIALLGATALAVDLGNAWQERRQLVNATDAAALAAAGAFATGKEGCTEAEGYLSANDEGASHTPRWCRHTADATGGVVTVEAEKTVEYAFAPVLGKDAVTIEARTSAAYGSPSVIAGGLRPFGLCLDTMNSFPSWKLPLTASTGVIRVTYGKDDHPNDCNGDEAIPGNWGMLDFDGGSNPVVDTKNWILDGYDGPVEAGTLFELCDRDPEACIDGDPGAWSNSLSAELDYLVEAGITFTLPIFDSGGGRGNNAYFHIVGFVRARLHGYRATGQSDDRYLDVEFLPGLAQGRVGDGTGIDTGLRVISICGVEATSAC